MRLMSIVYRCKLSMYKQRRLLDLFVSGCTARAAACVVGVNRMTAILFFRKIRILIFLSRVYSQKLQGVVEVDECYTSSGEGGRKAAKQGRNLQGKIALIGAICRATRQVFIKRVSDTKKDTLNAFCCNNISRNSVIHTDSFRSYNELKKYGFRHLKVNHFQTFKNFKTGACTNLIESCWAVMRRHLIRFNGGFRNNLDLWLAEIEMRIETRRDFAKKLKLALKHKLYKKTVL